MALFSRQVAFQACRGVCGVGVGWGGGEAVKVCSGDGGQLWLNMSSPHVKGDGRFLFDRQSLGSRWKT